MMVSDAVNGVLKRNNMVLRFLTLLLISSTMKKSQFCSKQTSATVMDSEESGTGSIIIKSSSPPLLIINKELAIEGNLSFKNTEHASKDFGNRFHYSPLAVLHPKSVSDIASVVKMVFEMGSNSEITVAARGHGHSLEGQAQAPGGIVINMESLRGTEEGKTMRIIKTGEEEFPYAVDVSGGELWINILHESLKHGLAPRSWTDYLHLTVGGTLSNAGVSGQAFKHGPQINNVYQLEVVTGTVLVNQDYIFFFLFSVIRNSAPR